MRIAVSVICVHMYWCTFFFFVCVQESVFCISSASFPFSMNCCWWTALCCGASYCAVVSWTTLWHPIGCVVECSVCTCKMWQLVFCMSGLVRLDTGAVSAGYGSEQGCNGNRRSCFSTISPVELSLASGELEGTDQNTQVPSRVWRCGKIHRSHIGSNATPDSWVLRLHKSVCLLTTAFHRSSPDSLCYCQTVVSAPRVCACPPRILV